MPAPAIRRARRSAEAARPKRRDFWVSLPLTLMAPGQLIPNGGLTSAWPAYSSSGAFSTAISGGHGTLTNGNADYSGATITVPLIPGRVYDYSVHVRNDTATALAIVNPGTGNVYIGPSASAPAVTTFTATTTSMTIYLTTNSNTNGAVAHFGALWVALNRANEQNILLDRAVSLGITGIRAEFNAEWWLQASPDYTIYDEIATKIRARGLTTMMCMTWAPADLRSGDIYPTSGNRATFASRVASMVLRYSQPDRYVEYYQLGNEDNLHTSGRASAAAAAADYLACYVPVAQAIRGANRSAKVVTTGISCVPTASNAAANWSGWHYLSGLYAAGGLADFDFLAAHPYSRPELPDSGNSGNGWTIMRDEMRPLMLANGDARKKILISEYGYPTCLSTETPTGYQAVESVAGDGFFRANALQRGYPWTGPFTLHTLCDYHLQTQGMAASNDEMRYGIIRADLSAKPEIVNALAPSGALPPILYVGVGNGSSTTQITSYNNTPLAGDFAVLVGANNTGGNRTVSAPLSLHSGTAEPNTGILIASGVLAGADTLTVSASMTRLRALVFRNAGRVLDFRVLSGNGTAVPAPAALNVSPRAVVYDYIYCETAGLTITPAGNMPVAVSSGSGGASWGDRRTDALGDIGTFAPGPASFSGAGGDWVRISVALE